MSLHDLLRAGSLDAAATWLLEERRPDVARHPQILDVFENPAARADAHEVSCAISAYLLLTGDHAGAGLAYAAGLGPAAASKVLQSCSLVRDPAACYALEDLPREAQTLYARQAMSIGGTPSSFPPPQVARLDGGMVFGLSFFPVTAAGQACPTWFVQNAAQVNKIPLFEDLATIPIGTANGLLGCFEGMDEFDEGILIGNSHNIGHWLLNHLARLAFVDAIPGHQTLPLVVGENIGATQLECLSRFGREASRLIRLRKGRLARFRRLWAPMMPFCSGPDGRLVWSPRVLEFLRRGLGVTAQGRPRPGKRLFITRRGAKWRRLLNEDVVSKLLSERGFQVIDPGTLSIAQQIELAADAEAICGIIGAGMSLVLFAPAGAKVIELKYPNPAEIAGLFPAMCRELGQQCIELRGMPLIQEHVKSINYDFMVPAHLVVDALKSLDIAR